MTTIITPADAVELTPWSLREIQRKCKAGTMPGLLTAVDRRHRINRDLLVAWLEGAK